MKVFFTASQRGKKLFDDYYFQIFQNIEKLGYKNLDDTIVKISTDKFYEKLEKNGHPAYVELYEKDIKFTKDADINIYECSMPSLSIGFMVHKSLNFHKPTIVLYLKNHVPYFLNGLKNEKLIMKQYETTNLPTVLEKCLGEAKKMRDKRFNFFINDDLLRYIDEAAKNESINKSTFLRNLVLAHKHKKKTS